MKDPFCFTDDEDDEDGEVDEDFITAFELEQILAAENYECYQDAVREEAMRFSYDFR